MNIGPHPSARPQISHVVFDFDGTLSWLRHGWPELMLNLFVEYFPKPEAASAAVRRALLADILSLNGKASIHQMRIGAQWITRQDCVAPDPEELLCDYQRRLEGAIADRSSAIRNGRAQPDDFLVHGARFLLERLAVRRLKLFILSGTAQNRVREEAKLLGIAPFFGPNIFGGTSDPVQSDKRVVLERLLRQSNLRGDELLSFGDGPVEIRITKELGGLAVGVASDEDQNGSGRMDPHKETQLRAAGADWLIPDYRDGEALLTKLLGS